MSHSVRIKSDNVYQFSDTKFEDSIFINSE